MHRPTRRNVMIGALSAPFVATALSGAVPRRPDVLMIAVDDLNTWVGYLGGHPQANTPNIDRLASQSFSFDYSYCAAPYCYPTRVANLWGLDPHRSGTYITERPSILLEAPTLGKLFKESGYSTHCVGKIYHSSPPDRENWDTWMMGRAPIEQWRQNSNTPICAFDSVSPGPDRQTDWGTVEHLSDMRDYQYVQRLGEIFNTADNEKPLFIALGFHDPHTPFFLPEEYWSPFEGREIVTPDIDEVLPQDLPQTAQAWVENINNFPVLARAICNKPLRTFGNSFVDLIRETGILTDLVRGYLASVSFVDDMVGRALSALEGSGRSQNTVVVLWSDHGFHLGEKLVWSKFTLWEEATRVPMLFRIPDGRADVVSGRTTIPVSTLDVMATLSDLGCFDMPDVTDSTSLLPLISGEDSARPALTTWGLGNHAIRDRGWRYIRYERGGSELYDLLSDPRCRTNLATSPEFASIKAEMEQKLESRLRP